MANDISIAGFGQCGSQIALEISASFDPRVLFNVEGLPNFSFGFSFKKFFSRDLSNSDESLRLRPNVYIGDLNANNAVYNKVYKNKLLREYFSKNEAATPKQAIAYLSQNPRSKQFGFSEEDEKLAQKIKNDPSFVDTIEALQFQSGNVPLITLGGAGGLQYLSELIADKDHNLLKGFPKQTDGMLLGIFSMGGGTGAGSLFKILSNYKRSNARYTVGIGILPDETESNRFQNAGRFLVKFLSSSVDERFDTLFLFSNRAAYMAVNAVPAIDKIRLSRDIINTYIIEFTHDFSMQNDVSTKDLKGKTFDYMDGKRYLSGIAFVGYANIENSSALDLFIRAISPLRYSNDNLSGVSVLVSEDAERADAIAELIDQIVRGIHKDNDVSQKISELNNSSKIYSSTKRIIINYFCVNNDFSKSVDEVSETILSFFRLVTTSKVKVDVNVFSNPTLKKNSCQIIVVESLCFEVISYIMEYIEERFFSEEADYVEFHDVIMSLLHSAFDSLAPEQLNRIVDAIESSAKKTNIAKLEAYTMEEKSMVEGNELISRLINEGDIRSVLLTDDHVVRSLSRMASLGARPHMSEKKARISF